MDKYRFYKLSFFLAFIGAIIATPSFCQHQEHEHEFSSGHHHEKEIGIGSGLGFNPQEKEMAISLHFHLLRNIGKGGKLSTGPGLEFFFDDHRHAGILWSFGWRPVHPLFLAVSPGVSVPLNPEAGEEGHIGFVSHFEALYEIEFRKFHIGPVIEYAKGVRDSHIGVSLHIGIHL